jgi:hypothetical protein
LKRRTDIEDAPDQDRRERGDDEHQDRTGHERQLTAQPAEEHGARRDPHRVHEQGQAEGLHEGQSLAEPLVGGAQRQAHEQGAGRPEAHRAERNGPQQGAQPHGEEDRQKRVLREYVKHPPSLAALRRGRGAEGVLAYPYHTPPRSPG